MKKVTSQRMNSSGSKETSASTHSVRIGQEAGELGNTRKAVQKTERGDSADREVNTRKPIANSCNGKRKTEKGRSRGTVDDNLNAGFPNKSQGRLLSTAGLKKGQNTAIRPRSQGRLPFEIVSVSSVSHTALIVFDSVTQLFYRRRRNRKTKPPSIWDKLPGCFTLVFFGFNVALVGMGITMISMGVIKMMENGDLTVLLNFDLLGNLKTGSLGIVQVALLLLIISGVVVTLLSVLGVVGVLFSSVFTLHAYIFILVVLLLVKIIVIALAFYFQEVLSKQLSQPLQKVLEENYDGDLNSTNAISRAFDYGHVLLGCCGVTSYKDFQKTKWVQKRIGRLMTGTFPLTCCRLKDPAAFLKAPTKFNFSVGFHDQECPHRVASSDNEYTGTPCDEKVKQILLTQLFTVYFITLAVFCLELLCIAFAFNISSDIKLEG